MSGIRHMLWTLTKLNNGSVCPLEAGGTQKEVGEQIYGSTDLVNILARILDSERNFNGSADPMITADRGFIQFWVSDFGFWLLGSSSLLFFLVSARFCFDTDVG